MSIQAIITSLGIPVIMGALVYIGRKLQILDSLHATVTRMDIDLKNLHDRFIVVELRVKTLWKDEVAPSHSPRRLNERGNSILYGSGIKEVIEQKRNDLFVILKTKTIHNPYDAEQSTLQIVNDLKNDLDIVNQLKTGAFSVGADIDTVLLVGGIYLRDLVFPELGFSLEDLDVPKNS